MSASSLEYFLLHHLTSHYVHTFSLYRPTQALNETATVVFRMLGLSFIVCTFCIYYGTELFHLMHTLIDILHILAIYFCMKLRT
jgi:hypothetical protein